MASLERAFSRNSSIISEFDEWRFIERVLYCIWELLKKVLTSLLLPDTNVGIKCTQTKYKFDICVFTVRLAQLLTQIFQVQHFN